jgi:ornithine carbamoyltransferase
MKKDFIAVADYSPAVINDILNLALRLKKERALGANKPILRDRVLAMVFQKPSLRTRVSFDMAMRHLGGDALYLSPSEIGLGKRESIADVARVLSGYVDAVMARVFAHDHILELSKWSCIPIINGLSDYNHPCQAMADVLTILEHHGSLKGLNVTFIGDGNNVAVSLMYACSKLGANFTLAAPQGFGMPIESINKAKRFCKESQSKLSFVQDPNSAVEGADVIYTDTWTSMGQESETAHRETVFSAYQVNKQLLLKANANAIVMHCLPAHRGQEITDEVADGSQSRLFPQAHNRMHAQKAILAYLLD